MVGAVLGSGDGVGLVDDTLVREQVELSVDPLALGVDNLECVAIVSVHLTETIWDTAVTHEVHDLVNGLGVVADVVPELSL